MAPYLRTSLARKHPLVVVQEGLARPALLAEIHGSARQEKVGYPLEYIRCCNRKRSIGCWKLHTKRYCGRSLLECEGSRVCSIARSCVEASLILPIVSN